MTTHTYFQPRTARRQPPLQDWQRDPFSGVITKPDPVLRARQILVRRRRSFPILIHRLLTHLQRHSRILIFGLTLAMTLWAAITIFILFNPTPSVVAATSASVNPSMIPTRIRVTRVPTTPTTLTTPVPTPLPIPIATAPAPDPILIPKFITDECIYRMQLIIEGEIGGISDQLAADFVATQVLYTAINSQCRYGTEARGSLESVWFGWRKYAGTGAAIILSRQTSTAVDRALFNFALPRFSPCLYIGSARDVWGVWLKYDTKHELSIDIALPAYPQQPQVFGLNCTSQGK